MFFSATDKEIISTPINFENRTSKEVNDMQLKPIKFVICMFAPVLNDILILPLSTSIFQEEMQVAKVILVHKGEHT